MSRHRNVRSMNYSEEYEGYDDVYGHSVEDDYTISPSDAAQFMYDRTNKPQMSAFFTEDDIAEEDENVELPSEKRHNEPDLSNIQNLNEEDHARLQSCLEEIRNVIGDSIPDSTVVKKIIDFDFDINKTLDAVLCEATAKPNVTTSAEEVRTVESVPWIDKDDKNTSLSNIAETLKQIHLNPGKSVESSLESRLLPDEASLIDLAKSFGGNTSELSLPDLSALHSKNSASHRPNFPSAFSSPENINSQTKMNIPSFDVGPFSDTNDPKPLSSDAGFSVPSFDVTAPKVSVLSRETKYSLPNVGTTSALILPQFDNCQPYNNDVLNISCLSIEEPISLPALSVQHQATLKSEVSSNSSVKSEEPLSLSDLAAQHQKGNLTTDELMSLSALAARHQKSNLTTDEPMSLSALAAQHQKNNLTTDEPMSLSALAAQHQKSNLTTDELMSLSALAAQHQKSNLTTDEPMTLSALAAQHQKNDLTTDEPMSLSALAAQHQNSPKSVTENPSLSSLAAQHLSLTSQIPKLNELVSPSPQSRFFIPKLISPPAKAPSSAKSPVVRPFSPVSREDSPVDSNSGEVIDLLSALNPPENRTKLEHPRVMWMEVEDEDDDEQLIDMLPDPTCLLDCVAHGIPVDTSAPLMTDTCSPVGRVLCRQYRVNHVFTFSVKAPYEGKLKRFLFDSPSPDDCILIRLGRKLPF